MLAKAFQLARCKRRASAQSEDLFKLKYFFNRNVTKALYRPSFYLKGIIMRLRSFSLLGMSLLVTCPLTAISQEVVEEVIVTGTRSSLMSAIDKQEAADSLISVVDSDALGDFPDTTAAEAIRRLSGISIENDQGEGRYVTIRGMSSDLNAVSINGTSVMSPENDRSVLLDGIPTELLDSITVSKSLTPDQDADAIGGRIDFETKNPSDLTDTLLKLKVDTQYNEQAESTDNMRVALTYGGRISENVAHVIGVTYSSKDVVTYNNETGYGWDSDGYMDDDWEMRYYDLTRERMGITYDIDYTINDTSRLYATAFWNEYVDDELRWKDEYGKIKMGDELPNGMTSKRIRHDAETRQREETRTIQAYKLGFETMFGDWSADMGASYSYAEEDDSKNADVTFRNYDKEQGGTFNWSDPQKPYFVADNPLIYNPHTLEFDELELEDSLSKDSELAFHFDMEKDTAYGLLKMGTKYRSREKDRDNNKTFYSYADKTMADFDPQKLKNWTLKNQRFSSQANPAAVFALRKQISAMELEDTETYLEDFVTEEKIFAIYGMSTIDYGNARIVLGARYENTAWDSSAFDQDGGPTSASKDYGFFAPSINVRYALSDQLVLRAAATRSLTRPGFSASAPILELEISGEDIKGKYGNPDLEPYKSTNFDLSLEYYTDEMTFYSAGFFQKDIENAIYKTIQKTATINGVTFNDGVTTWINADKSTIRGFEFNAQYGFDFGMYVAANTTIIGKGESTFKYEDSNSFTTPFRKMADRTANISLGYDLGPWDIRLAMNYRSDYLDWLADDEDDIDTVSLANSRFVDQHLQWDLVAKYSYSDNLTVKGEVININNRPEYYYWGYSSRLSQYDEYGTSYSLGFTYKM